MSGSVAVPVLPEVVSEPSSASNPELDPGYLVVCWDDPINLMDFVTHVFQVVFNWSKAKEEKHMLEVHHHGKSVLVRESLERAEHYVHQLQGYGLHATLEHHA
jgi:ATP-dependent Clp protease adaptor protein ClpS